MSDRSMRVVFTFSVALALLLTSCREEPGAGSKTAEERPATAQEALRRLLDGNQRFADGKPMHLHSSAEWRSRLVPGQQPFATILGCSDSRVPPELLFDQGFGDLFVIRVAGNVIGRDEIGSIEYAAEHLRTDLVVVLGHEACGAVTAALAPEEERRRELVGIQRLLEAIDPALRSMDTSLTKHERVQRGVEQNVRWSVEQINRLAEMEGIPKEQMERMYVVGAVYELETGKVRLIE